ncbi:hypothetical protein VZT92_020615 [Zoarces viviparus]|uniref:Uncharacterized protein n=1 Tax=Zoarces viviparus TaxID=48416 RepID=A0AAW1EDK8_ZOAVI
MRPGYAWKDRERARGAEGMRGERGCGEEEEQRRGKGGGMKERGVWRQAQVCVTGKRRELGGCTAIGTAPVCVTVDIGLHVIGSVVPLW